MADLKGWKNYERITAVFALLTVLLGVSDIILTVFPGFELPAPGQGSAMVWMAVFEKNVFNGLRGLGIYNVINTILLVLFFLALARRHRAMPESWAGLILLAAGSVLYISKNAALPFLAEFQNYTAAADPADKARYLAQAQAFLSAGEDFTPGVLTGFLLSELGALLLSLAVLRGAVFSRVAGICGLAGNFLMVVFTVWATFIHQAFQAALVLASVGGILIFVFNVMTAFALWHKPAEG